MTAPRVETTPSAPEKNDITKPEGFCLELFDRTKSFIQYERKANLIAEFEPQEIIRWAEYSRYMARVSDPMYLEKGMIFRSESFLYGLAYGKRGNHIVRGERELSVEFGLTPHADRKIELDTLWLRVLANQYPGIGSGRIYYDTNSGKIRTDCWSDAYEFGGPEMGRWENDRALSEAGLEVGVDLFRQIAKRAF